METAMTRSVGLIPRAAHLSFIRFNISFIVSNNPLRVGIVGATGAVGQELIALLAARRSCGRTPARSTGEGVSGGFLLASKRAERL